MGTSRTLNPLHFEDLEPHRFEDLIRQLIYDYRDWLNLEATGRLGGDNGFDVRGRERASQINTDVNEEDAPDISSERVWLVQCKREKSITPAKLEKYVREVLSDQQEEVYGVIFAAPCNFSKRARDCFIAAIREYQVQEFQLWGCAELEDQLFQPKNDHLLFAYFQISLQVRKRSVKLRIRAKLSTKRKVLKVLTELDYRGVLLRDPHEDRYPYDEEIPDFKENPAWERFEYKRTYHDGLVFSYTKYFAYLDVDKKHFDYAAAFNNAKVKDDNWGLVTQEDRMRQDIFNYWNTLPEENRAWLEVDCLVPYDSVIAIDEDGDDIFECPHLYVVRTGAQGLFDSGHFVRLYTIGGESTEIIPEHEDRIVRFPEEMREKPKK